MASRSRTGPASVSTTEARRRAAARYIEGGTAPIPVPDGEKKAALDQWQYLRLTPEDIPEYWDNGQNIGLLCGEPSGWRVDVDLDVPEAVRIAGRFLELTLTSGRRNKPHSHWWYLAPGAETTKFKDVDGTMLLELRSNGCQTLVEPSTHPSGDKYIWHRESGLKPVEMDAAVLVVRCRELATATFVARHLPQIRDEVTGDGGGRHDYAMALSGFLLRPGRLDEDLTLKILRAAWDAKGWPDERKKREAHRDIEGIVRDTMENLAAGEAVPVVPRWKIWHRAWSSGFADGGAGTFLGRIDRNGQAGRSPSHSPRACRRSLLSTAPCYPPSSPVGSRISPSACRCRRTTWLAPSWSPWRRSLAGSSVFGRNARTTGS